MRTFLLSLSVSKIQGIVFEKLRKLPPCTVSNEFLGDCEFMPLCLAKVPNCNDPGKFLSRQVYANSVDPDQTPIPSGFTMFAIPSASFWLIMSKNDPDQEWCC